MSVADCALETAEAEYYSLESDTAQSVPLLRCEGPLQFTLDGDATVEFAFVTPQENGYTAYDQTTPIEKVDYVPISVEDGKQTYRVDTAYSFSVIVTSGQGQDVLILDCRREI